MGELIHLILAALLVGPTDPTRDASRTIVSDVACESVAQCWLDDEGKPIARPRRLRGKPIPRGDCGRNLKWLRNRLTCQEQRCAAVRIGDKC